MKEAIGKRYGIDTEKLMRKKTRKFSSELDSPNRHMVDEDRTFFCSELIAKAYKVTSILKDEGQASSLFYPHHFSARGDSYLKLSANVIIEPEMEWFPGENDE